MANPQRVFSKASLVALAYLGTVASFEFQCYEDHCFTEKNQFCNHRKEIRHCDFCWFNMCFEDNTPPECGAFCKNLTATENPMTSGIIVGSVHYDIARLRRIELFCLFTLLLAAFIFCKCTCCCLVKSAIPRKWKLGLKKCWMWKIISGWTTMGMKNDISEKEPLNAEEKEIKTAEVAVQVTSTDQRDLIERVYTLLENGKCIEKYKNNDTQWGRDGPSAFVPSETGNLIPETAIKGLMTSGMPQAGNTDYENIRDCNKSEQEHVLLTSKDTHGLNKVEKSETHTSGFCSMNNETQEKMVQ